MGIALSMILAGVLPMPIVFLMRSFQCLKVDLDIHQGSIRRNETTASTKEMIDNDDDVSSNEFIVPLVGLGLLYLLAELFVVLRCVETKLRFYSLSLVLSINVTNCVSLSLNDSPTHTHINACFSIFKKPLQYHPSRSISFRI